MGSTPQGKDRASVTIFHQGFFSRRATGIPRSAAVSALAQPAALRPFAASVLSLAVVR
jgi:hypothetical protein